MPEIKHTIEAFRSRASDFSLSDDQALLYMNGWFFPTTPIDWISIVSFGANISAIACEYIKRSIVAGSQSAEDISGVFFVDIEEMEGQLVWEIQDEVLCEYLDNTPRHPLSARGRYRR